MLVCDDDPSLLEVARMLLSTHGYPALVAQSGAEAVRLAVSERPAVIILDLYMPSMDGWQTVEALKADPATADIPVLVLSVLDADDGAGLGELVERWITKPVGDSDALLEAVAELVDGDQPGRGCSSSRTTRTSRGCSPRRSSSAGLRVLGGTDRGGGHTPESHVPPGPHRARHRPSRRRRLHGGRAAAR